MKSQKCVSVIHSSVNIRNLRSNVIITPELDDEKLMEDVRALTHNKKVNLQNTKSGSNSSNIFGIFYYF